MKRSGHKAGNPSDAKRIALAVGVLIIVGGALAVPVVDGQGFGLQRRKLTIGGAFVDALVDFQRFGGEIDEVTPGELLGKGPQVYGMQHGRSIFAVGSGEPGDIVGIVTSDGGAVKASMTPEGFLNLQPAHTGFLTRNTSTYKALYDDKEPPSYTDEVILEYVDESGARLLLGGTEDTKTSGYLFKKDRATGEIIFRIQRDLVKEKASGKFLDPDVSSTFPMKVKFCDSKRANCVVRNIIKKPGDEIRLDPETRRINIAFNKDNLPYWKKYRTAQRLSWACEYQGRGFHFTYREGSLGGYLSCVDGVLKCARSDSGQKCNFDFRDYLARPAEAALFGLDWLLARKDPHTHYFTIAPDPNAKRHIRIGNLRHLDTVREVDPRFDGGGDFSSGGGMHDWVSERLRGALCSDTGSARCMGNPSLKVMELTSINDGITLIDERTGTKLKNVEAAKVYSLRQPYGWGKRGDFIAALITNKEGAAEVMALQRLNDEMEAPDLLEKDNQRDVEDDPVKAMLKGLEEEKKREIMKVKLAARSQALVIFPTTHIEDMKGILGLPVTSPPPRPAKILSLQPMQEPEVSPAGGSYRQPLPPSMPNY
jgi:hypothetical protein